MLVLPRLPKITRKTSVCNAPLLLAIQEIYGQNTSSTNFIKINIVEKFNSKNGNKYNADVISEFILISIEEFLYDEFVLKKLGKMKDDDLINIQNTRKVENSLKEIIKFINNALK